MIPFVDLAKQQSMIKTDLDSRIAKVLAHGKFILGPEVQELEEKLAAYVGVKHCVTCANGTDALLIALMSLGIGKGTEITLLADGSDEKEAVDALCELVSGNFGE